MTTKTLNLWGKGAVTLPKEWREKHPTKIFTVNISDDELVIRPIFPQQKRPKERIIYYEEPDGSFGLHFPYGIPASELVKRLKEADAKIRKSEAKMKGSRKKK